MVVLEGGGMLSTSGNQYLQPDYLSPLPTTLDAKKSPLALLAQTCSQIGADSPSTKPLMSSLDNKPKKNSTPPVREKPQPLQAQEKRSTPEHKVFKPYENNVVTKKDESRPNSKPAEEVKKQAASPESRKSVSPAAASTETSEKSSPPAATESKTPPRGASPIIKSGLEILQGKDTPLYKPGFAGLNGPLSALCCPPGLEHTNPAFRPSFPGAPFSPHHHMLYPGASPGPYLSYARVKTPSGGEALVPVCKDPYCTSCQFSMHNQQLMMSGATGPCPSGCTQCDHQKYNLAMAMSLVPPGPPPSSLGYPQLGRPNICSWVAGDSYCGKRFVTSEELLQHLRTHTNGTETVASTASSTSPFSHSLFSSASLHRAGYPNPPLSPLSAARYHPYGKPPTLPTTLAASPYSAFNPTALGPYYSPYSVYGQRLGAAAVHP